MAHAPALLSLQLRPLLASDVAFAVVFGIFVVALLTMIVIVITWALRRDREGRAAWRQRQQGGQQVSPQGGPQGGAPGAEGEGPPAPRT
jgi:hypothetical protein